MNAYPFNRITTALLPPGQAQTDATIAAMFRLARESQRTDGVRIIAEWHQRADRDKRAAARRVFNWMKWRTKFRDDPADDEVLQGPDWMIGILAESPLALGIDCKKSSTLAAALLMALGVRVALIVIRKPGAPDWHHVLAGAQFAEGLPYEPFDVQDAEEPFEWPAAHPIESARVYLEN